MVTQSSTIATDREWGITQEPFTESAGSIPLEILRKVFTGRDREIKSILHQLQGTNRKRILVHGPSGIGKTALILSILDVLQRKIPNILTCYISLPMNTDLGTAALIALAREMPDPNWVKSRIPGLDFEDLLDKALETVDRVIIAIDDLDKQGSAHATELLINAQGLLKGRASFILTSKTFFDQCKLFELNQELRGLDFDTTKLMLLNYLNSVRPDDLQVKDITTPHAFHPFTPAAADLLCTQSAGVPRTLNHFGAHILSEATRQNASSIDEKMAQEAIGYLEQR